MARSATTLMVDVVVTVNSREVLLIKRAKAPFADKLVMPGGHVEPEDPSLPAAAARELAEETGLSIDPATLVLLTVLHGQARDPRGPSTSVVYHVEVCSTDALASCKAGSDAAALTLRPLATLTEEEVGFDHYQAIAALCF